VIAPPNETELDLPDDFLPERKTPKVAVRLSWNKLTNLLAIATLVTAVLLIWIYINPQVFLNPYPPVVVPPTIVIPTQAATEPPQPTMTFTPSITPTTTLKPFQFPTSTPTSIPPTPIPVTVNPTQAVALTKTAEVIGTTSPWQFILQPGSPAAVSSLIMRPESDCKWMGVGGQVVDMNDAPILGLRVQLYGSLHGNVKDVSSLTGTVDRYGPGGYEIKISDIPTETNKTMWLQLYNQVGGAVSDKVMLSTTAGCEKNLIIVNFKQVKQ